MATQNFFCDWGIFKIWHSQRVHIGTLLFIIYINDLPLRINSLSEPVTFADDIGVIISSKNLHDFCTVSNLVLSYMSK
jgi:hypothetical protein